MGHVAYDALRKLAVGATASPIGIALLEQPWLFGPVAGFSLALELLAPVALLQRRIGQVWAVGMWSFHLGVLALMAISAQPVR